MVRMPRSVVIGLDNQAVIRGLNNQRPHPGHWILDKFIDMATSFREQNPRTKLEITWVPGHVGFEPNEKADQEAKLAAAGSSSPMEELPAILRAKSGIPLSISALRQRYKARLEGRWLRRWKTSKQYPKIRAIDKSESTSVNAYLKTATKLSRAQASVLIQLRTGHIGLNQHLHRINRSDTAYCPHCKGTTVESIRHFLIQCPHYRELRQIMRAKLRRKADDMSYMLSNAEAAQVVTTFALATRRLQAFKTSSSPPIT
jgi:hypothetical protein